LALAPTKVPTYPNAPAFPGVPGLKRDPLAIVSVIQLVAADAATIADLFAGPRWGIFTKDGLPLVVADTITAVDFRIEARVSDYPVESGGFQSYDKVMLPYDMRVEMTCGGTHPGAISGAITSALGGQASMDKTLFLSNLTHAQASLDVFLVLTPDSSYPNMNIVHYDYRRTRERGASMLHVEVWLQEIRDTATQQFISTQSPTSQADQNQGTQQPTAPPASVPVPKATPLGGALPVPPIPPSLIVP
jgi:hypothetical protein